MMLAFVFGLAAFIPAAQGAWPGREGAVFYRDLDPGPEGEGWEASGLGAFRVSPRSRRALGAEATEANPQGSPNGRQVVFSGGVYPDAQGDATASAIFIMRRDGRGLRQLTWPGPDTDDLEPTFDATGRRVLFVRLGDETVPGTNQGDIMSVSVQGVDLRQLTSGPAADFSPAVSPAGRQVVFTRTRWPLAGGQVSSQTHVFSIRPDGGRVRDLTPDLGAAAQASDPDFSPSGRVIAFAVGSRSAAEIFTMRPNGARLRQLTGRRGHAHIHGYGYSEPAFSPGGGRLLATAVNAYNTMPALVKMDDPDHPHRFSFGGDEPYWSVAPR